MLMVSYWCFNLKFLNNKLHWATFHLLFAIHIFSQQSIYSGLFTHFQWSCLSGLFQSFSLLNYWFFLLFDLLCFLENVFYLLFSIIFHFTDFFSHRILVWFSGNLSFYQVCFFGDFPCCCTPGVPTERGYSEFISFY